MRYQFKDLPALMRTPVGRQRFMIGIGYRAWPALSYLTMLYRRSFIRDTRVIAVVGSFGKTTVTRAILSALYGSAPEIHNRNSYSGIALQLLGTRPKDHYCVVEIGIDGTGQMEDYARVVRPDISVVTSIGSEHHRSLGSIDTTRAEKAEMIKALPVSGIAVLNGDDSNVCKMKTQTRARVIKFGLAETNEVRASDIHLDWPDGTAFKLHVNKDIHEMHVRLIGKNGVYEVLAAIAVSLAEGVALETAICRLEALAPTPGRLEPIVLKNGAIILRDDFKSTLETIDAALDVLEEIPAKRKVVVMGDVSEPRGSQGPIYQKTGARIAKISSAAVFLGGNYQRYAAGAVHSGLSKNNIFNAGRDVLKAAEFLERMLLPGDVVLIKGRDTQRLDRISLFLRGQKVSCDIGFCRAAFRCAKCPMLEKGWNGLKVIF